MAATCRKLMGSVVKGLYQLSNQTLWMQGNFGSRAACAVLHRQALHYSHGPTLTSAKVETQRGADSPKETETVKKRDPQQTTNKEEEEEEELDEPEYIPTRKAKNPMIKIGYAWMIGLPTGIIGFILAKRQVDKNRLKQLRIRQRMKKANEGVYESERYRAVSKTE